MRRTRFDDWPCPIARVTDLVGDWWTPLVMREAFAGRKRFEEFTEALGVSRPILTQRLNRLVEEGLLVKVAYGEHPPRFEYRLTEKGRQFYSVLAAMWRFGTDWLFDDGGSPLVLTDRDTGDEVRPLVVDENTGKPIDVRAVRVRSAKAVFGQKHSPSTGF